MIKKSLSEFIALRKEILRLKDENLRLKIRLEKLENENQKANKLNSAFTVFISAFIADLGYSFIFCFTEIIGTELKGLQFSLMLISLVLLGVSSWILWRRDK
ncbi:MAG: hypothetical protein ACI4M9_08455 [Succinivibrio sp.]